MNNYKAKTIKMTGFNGREEEVAPARERLLELKHSGIPYDISTEPVEFYGTLLFKCELTILSNPTTRYTGHSQVRLGEPNAFEAAETRAIGRALAAYGIAIESNYGSADEFSSAAGTVDPGAANSVREAMDTLANIKAKQSGSITQDYPENSGHYADAEDSSNSEVDLPQEAAPISKGTARSTRKKTPVVASENKEALTQEHIPATNLPLPSQQIPIPTPEPEPAPAPAPAPEPEAPAQVFGDGTNRFNIDIPELVNGVRSFSTYVPIIMELEGIESNMMPKVSETIVKLGLKDFISTDKDIDHWELLLKHGSKAIINTVLNTLV